MVMTKSAMLPTAAFGKISTSMSLFPTCQQRSKSVMKVVNDLSRKGRRTKTETKPENKHTQTNKQALGRRSIIQGDEFGGGGWVVSAVR